VGVSAEGARVRHQWVSQPLPVTPAPGEHEGPPWPPPEKPRNGSARRNPFDFALPDSAPPATETPLITAPSPGVRPKRRFASTTYVALGLGGALVLAAMAAGIVWYHNRPGEVVIPSEPAVDVQVLLDNKRIPVDGTPATLKLEPGSYVLTVQREGYVPYNEQIEIKPGETTRRRITLEPLASG